MCTQAAASSCVNFGGRTSMFRQSLTVGLVACNEGGDQPVDALDVDLLRELTAVWYVSTSHTPMTLML
jgi:hypothetical protein